jgi:hypothetical protein
LLEHANPGALIADTAYDADAFIETITERQITPVIPSHPRRTTPLPCDFALYCERNLVERFFNKLKHFRAIATRYDKLARNFLGPYALGFRYHSAQLNTGPNGAAGGASLVAAFLYAPAYQAAHHQSDHREALGLQIPESFLL